VAKRATTSSKHRHSKYFQAKDVAKKDKAQIQQDLEAKLNDKMAVFMVHVGSQVSSTSQLRDQTH
jgi:hypothetical protein